ncbi:ACT domain protein [uncultured archaeon]|nr:ACT domain protein [uncultured archaeon]
MKIDKAFFKTLKIKVMDGDFSIFKSKKFYPDAFANIKASELYTVMIENSKLKKSDASSLARSFKIIQFETIIPVNLVGFIAEIANTLANENISILLLSSYSTDHIIVRKKDLAKTIKTLEKLGVKK